MTHNPEDDREIDAYDDFVGEAGIIFSDLLKFNKGEWKCGDEPVPEGTQYAALVFDSRRGYVYFENGKPVRFNIGLVREGFKMPTRESLGDTDENYWPTNKRGEPQDPWSKQYSMPMINIETGETVCFVTGSMGGEQAVRELTSRYRPKARTSEVPLVSLQVDSYIHDTYGKVYNPIFKFEGWYDTGIIPPPPVKVVPSLSAPAATPLLEKPEEEEREDPITTGPQKQAAKTTKKTKAAKNADMDDEIPF